MNQIIIEIHPRKSEFDPLAKQVRGELIESGRPPKEAVVQTQRLYRIEGNLDDKAATQIAETLLVDPVVETVQFPTKKAAKGTGLVVDVWPKPGVTDPVGETVQKGLNDLGFTGSFKAASATRYVFPKIKDAKIIENLARRVLANELIHDIHIRKI